MVSGNEARHNVVQVLTCVVVSLRTMFNLTIRNLNTNKRNNKVIEETHLNFLNMCKNWCDVAFLQPCEFLFGVVEWVRALQGVV